MTTHRDVVWLFGIPIDRLTTHRTVEKIMEIAESREAGAAPRLVTTVNVDFLANALPWFGSAARHPELLRILRRADVSTADGMPLVWASRLLGTELPERVTGADMVPRLAAEAARRDLSIYLFGGRVEVARKAADILKEKHPGLRIAGVDSPFVTTTGTDLATAQEEDEPLCERINAADPDILLIAFGNPKQELWFARNRHRLKAGIALGIGGTFDFIAGRTTRAPLWMQNHGLEWLYRLWQEPRRLFHRYLVDGLKLGIYVTSAWLTYRLGQLRELVTSGRGERPELPTVSLFYSGEHAIRLVNLNYETLSENQSEFLGAVRQTAEGEALVFDCAALNVLDADQQGTLMMGWQAAQQTSQPAFLTNLGRPLRRSLRSNRCWDILAPYACKTPAETLARLSPVWPEDRGYISIEKTPDRLELKIFGMLETADVANVDVQTLAEQFAHQPCLVNLELCSTIDSTGIGFLSRVHNECASNGYTFCITGTTPATYNMIRASGLARALEVIPDVTKARRALAEQ
jgi:exopolysaccharide biosynthesis WecB/TagA/CpsF family protein/anti-anti-sigma factor